LILLATHQVRAGKGEMVSPRRIAVHLNKGAVMVSSEIVSGMLVRVVGKGNRIFMVGHASFRDGEVIVRHKSGSMYSVKPADLRRL
jgi:hypothetical protein